jgi:hypothetical protein
MNECSSNQLQVTDELDIKIMQNICKKKKIVNQLKWMNFMAIVKTFYLESIFERYLDESVSIDHDVSFSVVLREKLFIIFRKAKHDIILHLVLSMSLSEYEDEFVHLVAHRYVRLEHEVDRVDLLVEQHDCIEFEQMK